MKKIFFLLSVLVVITACEETVPLDLEEIPSRIAIRGQITDQPGLQYVQVTRSNDFYASGRTPRVTDAGVTITDDAGNETQFVHNPAGIEFLEGYYYPTGPFKGDVGHTYYLRVEVDGQVYEASDYLSGVLAVDSVTYEIDDEEFSDPEDSGKYYNVKLYAKEPQQTIDYYLFKFYSNGELVFESETDVYYSDDKTLAENIEGVIAPGYYAMNDTVDIYVYSISRQAFVFYADLESLLNNDGGMFSPPPANARTNLSNGALGLFQASAVNVSRIIIGQ